MKLILPKLFTIAIFLTLVATPEIAQSKEGKGNKKDYSKPSEKKYPRSGPQKGPHSQKPQRGSQKRPHAQGPQRGPQKRSHSQGPQKKPQSKRPLPKKSRSSS